MKRLTMTSWGGLCAFLAHLLRILRGKEASADNEFHVLSGVESLVEMGMNISRT